jgi:hypothetical protein
MNSFLAAHEWFYIMFFGFLFGFGFAVAQWLFGVIVAAFRKRA